MNSTLMIANCHLKHMRKKSLMKINMMSNNHTYTKQQISISIDTVKHVTFNVDLKLHTVPYATIALLDMITIASY